MTATDAIRESHQQTRVVHLAYDQSIAEDLMVECDEQQDNDAETEYLGTSETGQTWRVCMRRAAPDRITRADIRIGTWVDRDTRQSFRAAYVGECVLTGPEHATLPDEDLIAEAVAEAGRADILA